MLQGHHVHQRRRLARLVGITVLAVLSLAASAVAHGPRTHVPVPAVEGPITASGGARVVPQSHSRVALAPHGYSEQEFFLSGTAKTYLSPSTTAAYKTRMLVRRPRDAARFNGSVVVEWFNVSSGLDTDPDWIEAHEELLREGYGWVGVSAQEVGVASGPLALTTWDPVRYGSLAHPGDAYSYDIFSQAIRALEAQPSVLGGLRMKAALAVGKSQSAIFLHDYIDLGVQRDARVVDGFLLDGAGATTFPADEPTVPTVHFVGESEVAGPFADLTGPGPGPDSRWYRQWHVAGASHVSAWTAGPDGYYPNADLTSEAPFDGEGAGEFGQLVTAATVCDPLAPSLRDGGANRFQKRYALDAAIDALDAWVRRGRPAPQPPRFRFDAAGAIVRDRFGNASAGLRLPLVTVPLAYYEGNACGLFGSTRPFDQATLTAQYPTFAAYLRRLRVATIVAVAQRILRPADAHDLLRRARGAAFRWG